MNISENYFIVSYHQSSVHSLLGPTLAAPYREHAGLAGKYQIGPDRHQNYHGKRQGNYPKIGRIVVETW